jgi:hypothetical protein
VVRVVQGSRFLTERLQALCDIVHAGESDVGPAEVASVDPSRRSAGSGNGSNRSSTPSKTSSHLEQHGARTPAGLLTRILALCACINLNQRLGLTSRTLTPYTD